ncbi:anhydro-N-acetylmuramic acid kinase [Kineobactrum sediminis]|uniref:Anhydro-N-acetylmuramic acid kinase n=1 Tax=Kineobactrum sediminis TaxID=1905677 RepID=A0A2N5XY78_9GAMM|nr:anhydro-N-acetylmuramic acid kinase [Kineobactrum sediminis]
MGTPLYIGLMSGTSIDAIDCALVRCSAQRIELVATLASPIPGGLRADITAISQPGDNEIERLGILDRKLGHLFAEATLALLADSGFDPKDIAAIGSHGQTIRHRPPSAGNETAFSLQIGDPNTIAELTGITTVADFRRRDMAAGGEGAPLAPAFHAAAFATSDRNRAIVNIGGIANLSLLDGTILAAGFDTGPGNTLLDHWIARHKSERYDHEGLWAAGGTVIPALLEALNDHPYLACQGPRSTGKEAFNLEWVDDCLRSLPACPAQDVQATLAEFTAHSIAGAVRDWDRKTDEVYVCGGGAANADLMRRLQRQLGTVPLSSTAVLGLDPDWVEAAAFAWLAWRSIAELPGNAAQVTGAAGERVLGGIYPGSGGS